jgi:formate hydrogenlyase subunit 5
MESAAETAAQAHQKWPSQLEVWIDRRKPVAELRIRTTEILRDVARWVTTEAGLRFAGLILEQQPEQWEFRYLFYLDHKAGWIHALVHQPVEQVSVPSISSEVYAADPHEREAEDLFGVTFSGHPKLGDFVLHDDSWQESVAPMRKEFDEAAALAERAPREGWRPRTIVEAPGAFVMPIGPVYAGVTESAQFFLETVGEDVIRAIPRLFYKYRAMEKVAEGRTIDEGLLFAERFAATTAFAHALAYCQAVEAICRVKVPPRAVMLRVFLAELERFRHHVGVIQEISESTGLSVAASQAALLEEDLLRISGAFTGHRYLFGLVTPGGLMRDFAGPDCRDAVEQARKVLLKLDSLFEMLRYSSSFLDRLEGVGLISSDEARKLGLVGPIARASGIVGDLRKAQPYCNYDRLQSDEIIENEGDGFARLRVLYQEATQAVHIMGQIPPQLESGEVLAPVTPQQGAALGWAEAPRGATFHWVRLGGDGLISRYHVVSPSFINWHGFHAATENFAFQDFPIILATLGLSVAENDR